MVGVKWMEKDEEVKVGDITVQYDGEALLLDYWIELAMVVKAAAIVGENIIAIDDVHVTVIDPKKAADYAKSEGESVLDTDDLREAGALVMMKGHPRSIESTVRVGWNEKAGVVAVVEPEKPVASGLVISDNDRYIVTKYRVTEDGEGLTEVCKKTIELRPLTRMKVEVDDSGAVAVETYTTVLDAETDYEYDVMRERVEVC